MNRLSENLEWFLSFGEQGKQVNVILMIIEALRLTDSSIPFVGGVPYHIGGFPGDEGPGGSGGSGSLYMRGPITPDAESQYIITAFNNGTIVIGVVAAPEEA